MGNYAGESKKYRFIKKEIYKKTKLLDEITDI